jgi:hypothetical protein
LKQAKSIVLVPGLKCVATVWWHQIAGAGCCGGKLKVIAGIEEPQVIAKILAHLEKTAPDQRQAELSLRARAPLRQVRLI